MERPSERRLVTCVFIDVVQSTDLTKRLGPERMQRLLADAFAEISSIAAEQGGTIEKYIGDEVFIIFGAPLAHADDVARALRVADACVRKIAARQTPLAIRIGIETGDALVDLEAVREHQRMAVGTCVNVAARLQQHAEAGQVLVGPTCHVAARGVADFADLGPLALKGVGEIEAFRFLRLAEAQDVALPFFGRDAELGRLREAFERLKQGQRGFALVSGEPGIGKTRLAEEFVRSIADDVRVLRARIRPGTELGASPLRQIISADGATPVPAAVAHSAGIANDPRLLALSAVDRRNEIFEGWGGYLAELARERPLLLWIEDLHWAEGEIVRLVDWLAFSAPVPLMVLATARPEFPAMTAMRPNSDRLMIELGPLDGASATALARAAGATEPARIGRAEGHPLFIMELVRAHGALGPDLPVTVQAAIGARLDELPVLERELLQRVAVVGEAFDVRDGALLAERDPAEVAGLLGRLAHLRYVHAGDTGFRFHHALVRDVAYGRLPVAARMRLHAKYAREGLSRDDVEALAHHWWEALAPPDADWVWEGDREIESMRAEAVRAHIAAGMALGDRLAQDRAFEVYERALKLARDHAQSAEVEAAYGLALARNAKGDDATQHRLHAIDLYKAAGVPVPPSLYADTLDLAVFNWGYFHHMPSAEGLIELMDEGGIAARQAGDRLTQVRLLVQRAYFANDAGPLTEIAPLLDAVADKTPFADVLWRIALVHLTVTGKCADAIAGLELALGLGRKGAYLNEPEALLWLVLAYFHAGDLARAEASADRLLDISATKSAHTRQHAIGTKGLVRFGRGDWSGVASLTNDLRSLVASNPDASFCMVGANLAGYDAIAAALSRRSPPADLVSLMERLLPEARATRAALLLVPSVMVGGDAPDEDARMAYSGVTRLSDRQTVWDIAGLNLAASFVIRERWDDAERGLPWMDRLAEGGATFVAALAAAIREELAAARGGPKPEHADLRRLGYEGVSDLLSYRVRDRQSAGSAAGARFA
jgi:class 3 adenylate cyclase/tetratricopeptide (TPR) repeat protein